MLGMYAGADLDRWLIRHDERAVLLRPRVTSSPSFASCVIK